MIALVCGGRDYQDRIRVDRVLCELRPTKVIAGGAPGADTHAVEWAFDMGVAFRVYPADWDKHGRAAGPIRNQQMLDEGKPDIVIAFRGGRGTADMLRRARKAGVRVIQVDPPGRGEE